MGMGLCFLAPRKKGAIKSKKGRDRNCLLYFIKSILYKAPILCCNWTVFLSDGSLSFWNEIFMYLQEKRDFQVIYQAWDTPRSIFDELRGVLFVVMKLCRMCQNDFRIGEIKNAKMSSFSSYFQTFIKHWFLLYFLYELLMRSLRMKDKIKRETLHKAWNCQ